MILAPPPTAYRRIANIDALAALTEPNISMQSETRVQVTDALLSEWLESYELETSRFSSASLAAEVKLRRAEVFAEQLPKPHPLLTAVSFEVRCNVSLLLCCVCPLSLTHWQPNHGVGAGHGGHPVWALWQADAHRPRRLVRLGVLRVTTGGATCR